MNNNNLVAYAFDEFNKPVCWKLIKTHDVNVVMRVVDRMLELYPNAKKVYVAAASNMLKRDYYTAQRSTDFVDWIVFADEVSRIGLCFYSED